MGAFTCSILSDDLKGAHLKDSIQGAAAKASFQPFPLRDVLNVFPPSSFLGVPLRVPLYGDFIEGTL